MSGGWEGVCYGENGHGERMGEGVDEDRNMSVWMRARWNVSVGG